MTEHNEMTLESEQGFRALFEHATLGILVVDKSGTIELANPNIESLFGYKSVELIGQPIEILIPEKSRNNHVDHRSGYFHNPKTRPMGKGMELHGRRKDGSVFESKEPVRWVCRKCGHVHEGTEPPKACPACGHGKAYFERG